MRPIVGHSVLLVFGLASSLGAQDPDSIRADSAFRARSWKLTAQLYDGIARKKPSQGMAWLRLGIAHQALGELDPAIAAFEKALALNVRFPVATVQSLQADPRYKALTDRITAARFPCRTLPAARELDFWIGDWDVTPWRAPPSSNPAV